MLDKDVVFMKLANIKSCLGRIRSVTAGVENAFENLSIQESVVLNLQRAIQLCIDLGAHLISSNGWRVPKTLKETFLTLKEHDVINRELCDKLCRMIGFRNIAIHDYQQLDEKILEAILAHHLTDFEEFIHAITQIVKKG